MADDAYEIIECAQDALQTAQHGRTIEERIINNYYVEEYSTLENIDSLRQKSLKNGLRNCRFRSLCWRIFIECLPQKSEERIERIRTLRTKYEEICNKYQNDPRSFETNVVKDNPLSQDETSHWNRYFSDDELQTRIKQDVVRAFPDINFFQTEKIQSIMVKILFNYARENSQIEYKQGMHEILAPIIFVIHSDHQAYLFAQENGLVHNEIKELLDYNYLEHDSYFLFANVMERIECWYDNNSIKTVKKNEYVNLEPFSNDYDFNCYSKIGVKLKMISEQILCRYDEQLYNHLKDLLIPPQIYGIRWMRLLFIREFQMQDLLVLWDGIFANGFGLCDYIFTAMLVVIRKILLPCDYANCLNHLMRYPFCDVHYVIHLALHIRDPVNYPEPVEHSTLVLPNPNALKVQMANQAPSNVNNRLVKSNSISGNKNIRNRPKSLSINENNSNKEHKVNEMKSITFEWIEDKLTKIQGWETEKSDVCCNSAEEVEKLKYKIDFCARHMSKNLDTIQAFINSGNKYPNDNNSPNEDILLSIAELKKIRDILRGTIAFENSLF